MSVRSRNSTITCPGPLTLDELKSLEDYVNAIVAEDVPVTEEFITQAEAMDRFDMSRLPEGVSDTIRVVRVGDYDQCLCAGTHVARTSEIELKYDGSAEQALKQIEDKKYDRKYRMDGREIIRIGANFSSQTRCIEDWLIQKP